MLRRLISKHEYTEMPEDKTKCFIYIVELTLRNYEAHIESMPDSDTSLREKQSLQRKFIQSIASVGEKCGIKNISPVLYREDLDGRSYAVPIEDVFEEYLGRVYYALTSAYVDQRTSAGLLLLTLSTSNREKIKFLITKLRTTVLESNLSDDKKKSVSRNLDKINEDIFDKNINVSNVMIVISLIASVIQFAADGTTLAKDGPEILTKIMSYIGNDK